MNKIYVNFLPIAQYYPKNGHFRGINNKYLRNEIFTYLVRKYLFLFSLQILWTESCRIE